MTRTLAFVTTALIVLSYGGGVRAAPDGGEDARQYLEEGNQAYQAGDYQGALEAYEKAADTGYANGALYYNTGNAYYRLDQVGQAIRFYLKAERHLPGDTRLDHNLKLAQSRVSDALPGVPEPYYTRWWDAFVAATGGRWLFISGWVLCLAAASLLSFRILSGAMGPWLRRAMAGLGMAGVLLVVLAYAVDATSHQHRMAVVVVQQAAVRDAPGATPGMTVHEGMVVTLLGVQGNWRRIRLPDGSSGWVEAQAVGVV